MINPNILNFSIIYDFVQIILGGYKFTENYICARYINKLTTASTVIIDVGCGTGVLAKILGDQVEFYFGIDINNENIIIAKKKYANKKNCTFFTSLENIPENFEGKDIVVVMLGVMHHLADNELMRIFEQLLKLRGNSVSFVTCDPVKIAEQKLITLILLKLDRGKFIRDTEQYIKLIKYLAQDSFKSILANNPKELLLPYNNLITYGKVY